MGGKGITSGVVGRCWHEFAKSLVPIWMSSMLLICRLRKSEKRSVMQAGGWRVEQALQSVTPTRSLGRFRNASIGGVSRVRSIGLLCVWLVLLANQQRHRDHRSGLATKKRCRGLNLVRRNVEASNA